MSLLFCSYWDTAYDGDVMDNRVGLNLLYAQVGDPGRSALSSAQCRSHLPLSDRACVMKMIFSLPHQTVSDIERGWILVNKDQHRQLKSLQEKGSKKEVSRDLLGYFWEKCLQAVDARSPESPV